MSKKNGQIPGPGIEGEKSPYELLYSLDVTRKQGTPPAEAIEFYVESAKGPNTHILWVQRSWEGTEPLQPLEFGKPVRSVSAESLEAAIEDRTKLSVHTSGHEQEIIEAIARHFQQHYGRV